jgi:hypothetical protein
MGVDIAKTYEETQFSVESAIKELQSLDRRDPEISHQLADDIILGLIREFLPSNVYKELTMAYYDVPKWYA